MAVFGLQPSQVTTRQAIVAAVASRLGRPGFKIREAVDAEINAAIEDGTLVDEDGLLRTRDDATSWLLHGIPVEGDESGSR